METRIKENSGEDELGEEKSPRYSTPARQTAKESTDQLDKLCNQHNQTHHYV